MFKFSKVFRVFAYLTLCSVIFSGCAIPYRVKAEKFETDPEVMKSFSSVAPTRIVVPQNAKRDFVIENLNIFAGQGARFYCDLNDLYRIAYGLTREVLVRNKVPLSSTSSKTLSFTITNIQYEVWGYMSVQGCYLHFTVETSNGYRRDFRVQDQSGWSVDRAVGGALSRAVEEIFQDETIIAFIEDKQN